MAKLRFFTFIALTIGVISGSYAQSDSTYNFTLSEAQDFGIENYFLSKNSELDIEAAKKKIWETTAIGLPQISGTAGYQYIIGDIPVLDFSSTMGDAFAPIVGYIDNVGGVTDPQSYENYMQGYSQANPQAPPEPMMPRSSLTYGLTVSQLIFSGEYIVGLQASKTYKTLSIENYEKVKIDMRENIAGTYYGILIIEKNIEVLSETLENLKLNLKHTKGFFEQGLVEDTDVDQLDLVVKRTENSLRTIERQKEYMLNMLKYQLGLESTDKVQLTDKINILVESNIVGESGYVFNVDENIEYKLLSTQEDLQNLSLRREKTMFLPSVSGFYQYNDKTEKSALDFTINHMVGLNLSVPIASSGMRMAKVSQAKIELDKVQNIKEQEATRLTITAAQTRYDYNTSLQNYYNEQQNFELSEKVFNKTTIRFKEGLVSALDLSMINNQYLEAQLSYATAIQNLLTAKIKLDKAFSKL